MMLFVLENGTAKIPDCQERRYLYLIKGVGGDGDFLREVFPSDPDFGSNIYRFEGDLLLEAYTEFVTKEGDTVKDDRRYYAYEKDELITLSPDEMRARF